MPPGLAQGSAWDLPPVARQGRSWISQLCSPRVDVRCEFKSGHTPQRPTTHPPDRAHGRPSVLACARPVCPFQTIPVNVNTTP